MAELFIHPYATGDPRLAGVLDHLTPAQALGLLVLAELQSILETLRSVGVAFRGSDGARLLYSLRGEEKGSLTVKHLADMLAQMREQLRRIETAAQGHADGARAEDV